jgi:hypothetical protein
MAPTRVHGPLAPSSRTTYPRAAINKRQRMSDLAGAVSAVTKADNVCGLHRQVQSGNSQLA